MRNKSQPLKINSEIFIENNNKTFARNDSSNFV